METTIVLGLYGDGGKENGNYYSIPATGYIRVYIGLILG